MKSKSDLVNDDKFAHLLLTEASDAQIITNPEGIVVHWNATADDFFGYTSDEAMGRLLKDLVVPEDRQAEEFQSAAIQAGISTFEGIRRKKDGSLIYVMASTKAVRDAQGEIEFIVWSKQDVTRLK